MKLLKVFLFIFSVSSAIFASTNKEQGFDQSVEPKQAKSAIDAGQSHLVDKSTFLKKDGSESVLKALDKGKINFDDDESLTSLYTQVLLFIFLMGFASFAVIRFFKKGSKFYLKKGAEDSLRILENRSLGGKYFLVVVAYEEKKMLLSISPNGLQYLRDLDSDQTEKQCSCK